jgi:diguanylate cyclase (GGDEF)-like protein
MLELVAIHIAQAFRRAIEFDASSGSDTIAALPYLEQLTTLIASTTQDGFGANDHHGLLFIDVVGLPQIVRDYGSSIANEVLENVARRVRAGLRAGDILFRNGGDKFVALLEVGDSTTTEAVAKRVRDAIGRQPIDVLSGQRIPVRTNVTAASSPRDGSSLQELLSVASERNLSRASERDTSAVH